MTYAELHSTLQAWRNDPTETLYRFSRTALDAAVEFASKRSGEGPDSVRVNAAGAIIMRWQRSKTTEYIIEPSGVDKTCIFAGFDLIGEHPGVPTVLW